MSEDLKLEPQDIRKCWDEIKPGLEAIKLAWPELSTWRIEDVYAAVLAEQAVLYVKPEGFAVCMLDTDEYSGETDLFIWIAHSHKPRNAGMMEKYLPSFIEVARHLGCRGVSTISNHPALTKMSALKSTFTHYRVLVDGEEA